MPTWAFVPHFVDLLRDQDIAELVQITPVFSARGNGHLVALGLGGFFLCTSLKLLVDGLGCRHSIRAMMGRDVGFDGACLAPRWRKCETPWTMDALAAKLATLVSGSTGHSPPRLRTFSPTPAPTSGGACIRTPSPLARRWQRFADRFTQSRGTPVSWRTSRATCGRWSRSKCDRKVMLHSRVFRGAASQSARGGGGGVGQRQQGGGGRGGQRGSSEGEERAKG